ncbi:MAG: COG1361 S-layer family protein [Candidatus Diapherotrites archaeon]|uniref:COG1361 S-layer family protein n=1 Tax=Candidatus Iainarchaeum sp. TaxID=3101447 RepID=A0A8T4L5V4_9ARCH|nr:COG1361 S-layer family protein [Candidatus Diapherotrites archaeon]
MNKMVLLIGLLCLVSLSAWAAENDVVMSSYNYEPAPVEAGQTFELWIHVKNSSGKDISGIEAVSKLEYPFSLPDGETPERVIGTLTPEGTALINYEYIKVDPNTPSGEYKFEFKVGPRSGTGRNYYVKIKVTQKKPDIELVAVMFEPRALNPGLENGKARLTLKNLGKTTAFDVKASMAVHAMEATVDSSAGKESHIKPIGSPLRYIERIAPGEEKTAELEFSVDRGADLKTYLIPLQIEYKNENNVEFSFERNIGAEVTDSPELDVVLVAVDPQAVIGRTAKISMDVFNAGGATASYVVAEPSLEGAEKIIPEKVFIGTLEPDDFDSFTFQVKFKENAKAGVYPVKVRVSYTDKGFQKQAPEKNIDLTVYTPEEAAAMARQELPLVPIAGGLAVLGFLFRKRLLKLVGLETGE